MTPPANRTVRAAPGAFALVLVMIVVAATAVIGVTFLSAMAASSATGRDLHSHLRARMLAESALDLTLTYIRNDPDWRTTRPDGVWLSDHLYGAGTISVTVEDGSYDLPLGLVLGDGGLADDVSDPATVTATGAVDGVSYEVRSTVIPTFIRTGGLSVSGSIDLSNSASIDSWDSAQGGYGGGNSGSDAVVTTNSVADQAVEMSNSAAIGGSLYVGPGGNPDAVLEQSGTSQITGTTGSLTEPVSIEPVSLPASLPLSLGSMTYSNAVSNLVGTLRFNDLKLSNNTTLTIIGDVTIVCDGTFQMSNSSRVVLASGARLTLYAGGFSMSNNTQFNVELADPSAASIYCTGGSVSLTNSSEAYANVRAPAATLSMSQFAQFYGTFRGANVTMSNNTGFHQDLNPDSGTTPTLTGMSMLWIEPQ